MANAKRLAQKSPTNGGLIIVTDITHFVPFQPVSGLSCLLGVVWHFSWIHERGRKALLCYSWIIPEGWAGLQGDGRAGSGLSEISLTSFLLLKLVLCLGKSRRSCGQLAKLSSKYKGEEREEKPDLPETTESKNGAAWVTTWGHSHRTFPQLSPLLLWRTHSFLPFPPQHRVVFAF